MQAKRQCLLPIKQREGLLRKQKHTKQVRDTHRLSSVEDGSRAMA